MTVGLSERLISVMILHGIVPKKVVIVANLDNVRKRLLGPIVLSRAIKSEAGALPLKIMLILASDTIPGRIPPNIPASTFSKTFLNRLNSRFLIPKVTKKIFPLKFVRLRNDVGSGW